MDGKTRGKKRGKEARGGELESRICIGIPGNKRGDGAASRDGMNRIYMCIYIYKKEHHVKRKQSIGQSGAPHR